MLCFEDLSASVGCLGAALSSESQGIFGNEGSLGMSISGNSMPFQKSFMARSNFCPSFFSVNGSSACAAAAGCAAANQLMIH